MLLLAGILAVLTPLLWPGAVLSATGSETAPQLEAKSWQLIDARSGEPLAAGRPDRQLLMASTTKLMTAYLALRKLPLSREVRAIDYLGDPAESLMDLTPGQRVSVRDLLYGLILLSGNDAAATLAVATSGSESAFVASMNRSAKRLGLKNTHYENPIGLDGSRHYTSAADLASLSRTVMEIPRFRRIAAAREATLRSYSPPKVIESKNSFLLDHDWAHGIKTGHTLRAGYVLASDARRKATELIAAVVGAPTENVRNAESVRLLDYGFSLYRKRLPVRPPRPVTRIPVRFESTGLALKARRPVRIGVRADQSLKTRVVAPDRVEGPVARGERLGRVTVALDGERIARLPLFAARAVAAPTVIDRLRAAPVLPAAGLLVVLSAILGAVAFARRKHAARTRQRLQRVVRK